MSPRTIKEEGGQTGGKEAKKASSHLAACSSPRSNPSNTHQTAPAPYSRPGPLRQLREPPSSVASLRLGVLFLQGRGGLSPLGIPGNSPAPSAALFEASGKTLGCSHFSFSLYGLEGCHPQTAAAEGLMWGVGYQPDPLSAEQAGYGPGLSSIKRQIRFRDGRGHEDWARKAILWRDLRLQKACVASLGNFRSQVST